MCAKLTGWMLSVIQSSEKLCVVIVYRVTELCWGITISGEPLNRADNEYKNLIVSFPKINS